MPVLLIGTLDTKGIEFQFVRDLLRSGGVDCLVLDAGVLNPPVFSPDIPREPSPEPPPRGGTRASPRHRRSIPA